MADIIRRAELSSDRVYRYSLSRIWEPTKHPLAFIGLNPSTADETEDDPTIRRCMGFARDGGYGGVLMLNLFAFRSTKPKGLLDAEDPVGPQNDAVLLRATEGLPVVVCAWGTNGVLFERNRAVLQLLSRLAEYALEQQLPRVNPVPILKRDQVEDMVGPIGGPLKMKMGVEDLELVIDDAEMTLRIKFGFTQAQLTDSENPPL